MDCTALVLLYGRHADLARRCLGSLVPLRDRMKWKVWLNAVGDETREYLAASGWAPHVVYDGPNVYKYPAMWQMLHCRAPVATEFVMWWDDDSCLTTPDPPAWLDRVAGLLAGHDMVGAPYHIPLRGDQSRWIEAQPWYAGKPVRRGQTVKFCQGAWWAAKTAVLRKHGWPVGDLRHNGGDVMLGELCRQQGYSIAPYRDGVAINADDNLKESASPRRGYHEDPVGTHYEPP